MIQRIQSVFLFLAAASGFGILAAPFATAPQQVEASPLFADAAYSTGDHIGLLVLFALAGALALAGIFLFKNRPVQLKISRLALIANILGFVLAVILFWQDVSNLENVDIKDGLAAYLPLAFIVFAILALRSIGKDEALVKSMDRLR